MFFFLHVFIYANTGHLKVKTSVIQNMICLLLKHVSENKITTFNDILPWV